MLLCVVPPMFGVQLTATARTGYVQDALQLAIVSSGSWARCAKEVSLDFHLLDLKDW